MGPPELLALSLGLSIAVAALAWAGGRLVERLSADPRLRDRVWAAAMILPALPPLAISLMLLTPAPLRDADLVSAFLPTTVVTTPAAALAVAPSPIFAFDPTLAAWAVLGIAALLTIARVAALAHRVRRLVRIVRDAAVPGPAVVRMVESAANEFAIGAPRIGISTETSEALLASLGHARLILPVGLTDGTDPAAARAVIAHEMAHLKRGDHRTLWLEEALLVLLAANPLMPTLRARRAAAREEACDALALYGTSPETRRAYARSLIEALRNRAAPQASGGLPALTFTGAGRNTSMHRLKAVLNPVPAAGRGARLVAYGLAGLIAAAGGAGSLAVAGEREAVIHMVAAPATAPILRDAQQRTVVLGAGTRTLLNGKPLPEGLPMWAISAERINVSTPPAGSGGVNFILPFTGTTPVSVNGHLMPEGFPASGVVGDAVERVDIVGDHVQYTLKPEADVRRARREVPAAPRDTSARAAVEPVQSTLTPEQQARYRNTTARQYQALCASADPGDEGFCSGVMFGVLVRASQNGLCPPATMTSPDRTGSDLGTFVDRGRREIAGIRPNANESAYQLAERALKQAYPCGSVAATPPASEARFTESLARFTQSFVPLTVSADIEGRPLSVQGDEVLRVLLTDETGAVMNTFGSLSSGKASGPLGPLGMAINTEDFPKASESARTYTLTGEIRGPGRVLRYVAEPVTLRLAPGARHTDLRPTLNFRPA